MPGDYPGWLYPAAWLAALALSASIFMFLYWRSEDLRKAFMVSLAWLKAAALVLWLAGLDRPVLEIVYVRGGATAASITLTANTLIALALLATNTMIWAWPDVSRELLGRREEMPGLRR